MTSATRWAGVPLADRRAERRNTLVATAFDILGSEGEAALSVRSVSRACVFHTRYFYESFEGIDELVGAVYDQVAAELGAAVDDALSGLDSAAVETRLRAGIRAVLEFGSTDPRRGRVLFTEARANPVLVARRAATQDLLRQSLLAEHRDRDTDPTRTQIAAAMFTGAMSELAQQWLTGALGDDLDHVVEATVALLRPRD